MIDIVFNIDDGYAQHCAATISSLFWKSDPARFRFHIMATSLSEQNENRLRGFVEGRGAQLHVHRVEARLVEDLPNLAGHHVSAAAYLRLFMSEILPPQVDKVIYLDCDLIVAEDIALLWEKNVDGYALCVVEDAPNDGVQVRLGYDEQFPYFNSGVLIVNLKYWRENDVHAQLMKFLEDHSDCIVHHDQDVLNAVLHDKAVFEDLRWNMLKCYYRHHPRVAEKYRDSLTERLKNPAVIHFTGRLKPWDCWINHPFAQLYFRALEDTPWKGYRYTASSVIRKRGVGAGLVSITGLERLIYFVRGGFRSNAS